MSKMSKEVQKQHTEKKLGTEINFMGGHSFKLNPLETLRLIASSSIFGEPSYYRDADKKEDFYDATIKKVIPDDIIDTRFDGKTTTEIFESAIDAALDFDFEATLRLAVDLRSKYYMRLNPQVIMVRAALHPKRQEFTKKNPGLFRQIESVVMHRGDEPATQVTYYLHLKGDKAKMPSLLKRSIADKLSSLSRYEVSKYKNAEIGMINAVRISHASSPVLNELMRSGTVQISEDEETWERLRSNGMDWRTIAIEYVINRKQNGQKPLLGHMALLRNLKNIFLDLKDPDDRQNAMAILQILKDGVPFGKQFPFRYHSAFKRLMKENIPFKAVVLDGLEECIDISIQNLPHLNGKTVALSDNSGSAWDAFTSEYGTEEIAVIDNLSSVIAAMASDEGYVGKFGDRLEMTAISTRNGALTQAEKLNADRGRRVGHATEAGIWHFFRDAIKNKTWVDNIFIFSDMQAGTGQLYGEDGDLTEYTEAGFATKTSIYGRKPQGPRGYNVICGRGYIDVYKLVQKYRSEVNPKVNVFCVQTAGYNNVIMPTMSYRTAMLAGWTGKEVQFAADYIHQWDEIEKHHSSKKDSLPNN